MDNFDELKRAWLSAPVDELPPPAAMIRSLKQFQQKQLLKSIGIVLLAVVLFATMIWVLINYHSFLITTRIGEALMLAALIIFLSLRLKSLKRVASFKYTNEAFLQYLKQEQIKLIKYQKTTQAIGFSLASAGLLLYLYEGLHEKTSTLIIGYSLAIVWITVMWLIVRPLSMKRKEKALNDKIKALEKIVAQLNEN